MYLYIISIILLILTLIIGSVTRGTVRWIPLGSFSFQASEVARPFLLLFFAKVLTDYKKGFRSILKYAILAALPVILIAIQPSFGVSFLTFIGISAIFLVKILKGKNILMLIVVASLTVPSTWYLLKPYQKDRILTFFQYEKDPKGSGYNTIQSIISIGSGRLLGRGFKKGFQTQLRYLPEKHTDFVFAGISEELGFFGSMSVMIILFILFFRMLHLASDSDDETFTLFVIGSVAIFITETIINIGMNLGMLPITGLPLPFISAGGSSLIASLITTSLMISGKNIKPLR